VSIGKPLTARQEQILGFIRSHIAERGFPPTRKEIAKHFGFRSPNAAQEHLHWIERKGYITVHPEISRGIQVTV
jgi:repressor LexA